MGKDPMGDCCVPGFVRGCVSRMMHEIGEDWLEEWVFGYFSTDAAIAIYGCSDAFAALRDLGIESTGRETRPKSRSRLP
jgi:hypothetical protein